MIADDITPEQLRAEIGEWGSDFTPIIGKTVNKELSLKHTGSTHYYDAYYTQDGVKRELGQLYIRDNRARKALTIYYNSNGDIPNHFWSAMVPKGTKHFLILDGLRWYPPCYPPWRIFCRRGSGV